MGMHFIWLLVCIVGVAVLADVTAAGGPLVSRPLSPDALVDGQSRDWPSLDFVNKQVAVGVANGPGVLHVAVATSDPEIRQRLLSAGLILYLDRTGRRKQTFGIRVPALGRPLPELGPATPRITYVELVGPAKDQRRLIEMDAMSPIRAAVGNHDGTVFLEFGIPLVADGGGGIGFAMDDKQLVIGLGLVTPDPIRSGATRGEPRGSGGRRGGSGGRGGAGLGAAAGGPGNADQGKALKAWTAVALVRHVVADVWHPGENPATEHYARSFRLR